MGGKDVQYNRKEHAGCQGKRRFNAGKCGNKLPSDVKEDVGYSKDYLEYCV